MFDAGKLLNQMFGAGGANNPLGQIGGMLGGLLNDSVSGMKDGAAAIEQKTGIGAKADAALKGATGKSGGDLFEQAKTFASENKMMAGGALGGLGLLLLGTRGGRGLVGSAATLVGSRWWAGLPTRRGRTIRRAMRQRPLPRSKRRQMQARSVKPEISRRTMRQRCWCCAP